jgi:hypothetical protein
VGGAAAQLPRWAVTCSHRALDSRLGIRVRKSSTLLPPAQSHERFGMTRIIALGCGGGGGGGDGARRDELVEAALKYPCVVALFLGLQYFASFCGVPQNISSATERNRMKLVFTWASFTAQLPLSLPPAFTAQLVPLRGGKQSVQGWVMGGRGHMGKNNFGRSFGICRECNTTDVVAFSLITILSFGCLPAYSVQGQTCNSCKALRSQANSG